MTAEELMRNDWVYNKNDESKTPFQVKKIDKNTVMDKSGCYSNLVDIRPIPLTPEILEKNGWEERPTGYVFYTDGKRYDNSLWYIFGSNTFVVNTAEFQIKYVHELQHALRLCNINKEIEV